MSNEWTNQLNIAKQEVVGPSFLSFLFARTQKPVVGWSQVIFHRNQFIEEIPPANASNPLATQNTTAVIVREGDVIVSVYRGSRLYDLTGTVSTKDKYQRLYDISLSLEVHHPIPAAKEYYQEKDPAGKAITQVKSWFEEAVQSYNHDQFPNLPPLFDKWNNWLKPLGIAIQPEGKTRFSEDPYYSELARIELEKEIKRMQEEIKYEQEKLLKVYENKKKEIERDFARREEVKDQIHKICSELLQVAADEIKDTLRERVHEGFEKGYLTSQIWDELYTVLYAIGDDERQINLEQRIMAHVESMNQGRIKSTADIKRNTATSAQDTEPALDRITN